MGGGPKSDGGGGFKNGSPIVEVVTIWKLCH